MTRWTRLAIFFVLSSTSCAARGQATAPASLFDPARHIRVAEIKPGMKGYGLSVFEGTRIDRFEVEVVSVLRNFRDPKYDVILIRCAGANLEHTGPIAGMSGSPIYLTDDQGRSRLAGAFAYGWSMMKDPLAGVQPIEYMVEIGSALKPAAAQAATGGGAGPIRYTYDPFAFRATPLSGGSSMERSALNGRDPTQLQPLGTPLMTAGISQRLIDQYGPWLKTNGLIPLQAGATAGSTSQPVDLAPGSVMAAPLLSGDVSLTALGTCTEVIGNRVFGFGHPFNNEGPITLPMASGRVHAVIATLSQSFKIGAIAQLKGTLVADQAVGVAGELGPAPATVPIEIRVIYMDGSLDTTYHFNAAWHPRLTPTLTALAVSAALTGQRELPQYHTVEYDLSLDFADSRTVKYSNAVVNTAGTTMLMELATPLNFATQNPFDRVVLKRVSGTMRVYAEAREAEILSVNVPKLRYKPGETLNAYVRYRPFRAPERILPIQLELPHDLRHGTYELSVTDQPGYVQQEQTARAFRFNTESVEDVFAVLNDVTQIREDAVYVRLMRQADGVAVGRTALPRLPSSRRHVLLEAGLSNITPFVSTAAKIIPTGFSMTGSADFEIEIDSGHNPEPTTRASRPAGTEKPDEK